MYENRNTVLFSSFGDFFTVNGKARINYQTGYLRFWNPVDIYGELFSLFEKIIRGRQGHPISLFLFISTIDETAEYVLESLQDVVVQVANDEKLINYFVGLFECA